MTKYERRMTKALDAGHWLLNCFATYIKWVVGYTSTDWVAVAGSLTRMVVYGDEIDWWHKSKKDRGNDQGCEGERFRSCSLATWFIRQVVALVSQRLAYMTGIYTAA